MHTGTYTIPAGQTLTRLEFTSLVGGTVGNFIDGVSISRVTPPIIPTMTQWALFLLGLVLTSMAVVTIRKSVLAVS